MTYAAVVIGDPVEHSLSPALHNAAFAAAGIDGTFSAMRVRAGEVAAAIAELRARGVVGASVTVPHKQAVIAECDRLEAPADAIGAVNCVKFNIDETIGHNTDAGGYADSLAEAGHEVAGRACALLGGGGAARAVAAGLQMAGCASVTVVARTPAKVDWADARPWTDESLAALLPNVGVLVDCTSAGLSAESESNLPAPIPLDALVPEALVSTLIYHRETALLSAAGSLGLATIDGAGMLVHQGARAFRLWTGVQAPVEAMWTAMRAALRR